MDWPQLVKELQGKPSHETLVTIIDPVPFRQVVGRSPNHGVNLLTRLVVINGNPVRQPVHHRNIGYVNIRRVDQLSRPGNYQVVRHQQLPLAPLDQFFVPETLAWC